ncbi:hypothetical protein [Desulfosporosinus sp. SB140]|uniref:hypothetical protein n=1 Tax=Desulfosporosinus paludis TaxID=3115649 RepID=UPI00388E4241
MNKNNVHHNGYLQLKPRYWFAEAITRQQGLVLLAAWIGWVFDSMDSTIYAMVMPSSLQDLLGYSASKADIASRGGIILAIFLVGWALGGLFSVPLLIISAGAEPWRYRFSFTLSLPE